MATKDTAKVTPAKPPKTTKVDGLRVTAKRDGFRRGGREWHGTTEVPTDAFTEDQLEQIFDENGHMLVVEEIKIEVTEV